MRIVAGELGGRTLLASKGSATRPMTDKVRAALFNILGPIDELTVLDAYAGSGALGLEALSRGASRVIGIESGREAAAMIKHNVASLKVGGRYRLEYQKVEIWLAKNPTITFDLIFAMPPYALLDRDVLAPLARLLNAGGIMIVEYPRQATDFGIEGLTLVDRRSYNDPQLAFYQTAKTG